MKHDVAFVVGNNVMQIFSLVIEPDEFDRVFAVVYATVKAGLEFYDTKVAHQAARLNPSKN